MAGRWWSEATLDEQLDAVLDAEVPKHLAMFNPPQREHSENYNLGVLLLRRHGIRLHLHPRGPFVLHFAEGLPEDPEQAMRALKGAFDRADEQLKRFWEPLWLLQAKGPLRQHSRWLVRREEAISANGKFCGELERLREKVARDEG